MITPAPATAPPQRLTRKDINVLKAQEKELAYKIEVNDKIQKLKAEHAALQDRIRIAEMEARELDEVG